MQFNYNISDLLKKAHGVTGTVPSGEQYMGYLSFLPKINGYQPQTINLTEQTATSYLGTPIIMPIAFDLTEVSWFVMEDGIKITKNFYGSTEIVTLPPASLIDFQQTKIIEKTRIAGRNGTVKEYIGLDDWTIRIRGIIINETEDTAPEEQITLLKQLKDVPCAIPLRNEMARWLDIRNVVIEDIEFPSLEGSPGVQPYTITMSSDEVFELKYKNGL